MDEQEVYCICRQPADDRFMIACDKCEEWYHGECIGLIETDSKYIKYYYCDECRKTDPSLKTKMRRKKEEKGHKKKHKHEKREKEKTKEKKRRVKIYSDESGDEKPPPAKPVKSLDPMSIFSDNNDSGPDDDFEKFLSKQKEETVSKKRNSKEIERSDPIFEPDSQELDDSFEPEILPKKKRSSKHTEKIEPEFQPQCLGPRCCKPARRKSKYCSDACGRALAAKRIERFLMPKLEKMAEYPSVATIEQTAKLEKLKASYNTILKVRTDLEEKFKKLEEVIAHGKQKKIVPQPQEDEGDEQIFCVVCGHLASYKTIFKHIDKCYRRVEQEMSYGSALETKVEGSKRLFCDHYNPTTMTYCKRLKVMCPEHNKEQKIDDTEVCGCPLQSESFYSLPLDEIKFCQNSKKNCRKHYCWEKMYRAEIDIKRIRTLIKLDENLEERRKVEFAISNRFGCALLMMNETIQHSEIRDLRPASRIAQTLEIAKRLKADLKLPEGNTQPTIVKSEEIKTEIEVV